MRRFLLMIVLLGATSSKVNAQDSHYWTVLSGARATLMGGVVVAVESDLSASFYNPGALARNDGSDALSMFAKTTNRMEVELGSAPALTATSDIGNAAPGFFALRLPGVHIVDGDIVTFSYLVRQSSRLDLGGQGVESPSIPTAAADLFIFQDIYDGWYGLSWARDVESVGIGVSVFYSSVSYRQRLQERAAVLPGDMTGYLLSDDLDYKFTARRLIAKAGATWTTGPFTLGGTVTLPSLRLPFSEGTVSVAHTRLSRDPSEAPEVAQDSQTGVSAQFKQPLSVALGAQAMVGPFEFNTTAEWFAGLDSYDVLETAEFTSQLPPVATGLPIVQSRESVFNAGVAVAWQASSHLSFFGSARTDQSFRDGSQPTFVGLDHFDLVHFTGGIGVATDQLDVWLGGILGSGEATDQLAPSPLPDSPSLSALTSFRQVGFVMAFSASF